MESLYNPLSKGVSLLRLKEKEEHRRRMANHFFGDIWIPLNYTGDLASDVRVFLDGSLMVGDLKRRPHCTFIGEFLRYCASPQFKPPLVASPAHSRISHEKYLGSVTRNKLMPSVSVAFMAPPAFKEFYTPITKSPAP